MFALTPQQHKALVFLAWPIKDEYDEKECVSIEKSDMGHTEKMIKYLRTEYESDPNGKEGESDQESDVMDESDEERDATNKSRKRVIAKVHIHTYPDSTSPREMRVECRSEKFPVFALPRIAEWDDAGVKIKQVERCQCKRKAIKLPVDNKPKPTG